MSPLEIPHWVLYTLAALGAADLVVFLTLLGVLAYDFGKTTTATYLFNNLK